MKSSLPPPSMLKDQISGSDGQVILGSLAAWIQTLSRASHLH